MRHHHSDDQDIGHRVLGALLSLALGVGFFHYGNHSTVSILALNELSRDIWPDQWWPGWNLSREAINTLLLSKWIVALVGCVFFFVNLPKWGALSLFFGVVIQLAVYSIDRRTMGNYHFMPLLMATAYLFFPRKIALTAWLMACFYLGAGLLKLNSEWLSGSAFPRHWFDPSLRSYLYGSGLWLFQTGTHFVVLLELSLVFLLFSSIRLVRWTALSLFVLFHGLSYLAVGWFYPLVMALLLPVFPVYWANRPWDQNSSQKRPTRGGLGFLAVFLLLQLLPLFLEKDPALS